MTSDRESVEKDRHDFTSSELTDLRGLHEAAMAALRAANETLEESIRIQRRAVAAIAKALREAAGQPCPTCARLVAAGYRAAAVAEGHRRHLASPIPPSAEQIEAAFLERRGGR